MFFKKNRKFHEKNSKIRKTNLLKTNPLKQTTIQFFLSDREICFQALAKGQISKIDKNFRKP